MNDYFRHIEYAPLRHYNQCVMAFNIAEDDGQAAAQVYLNGMSKQELQEMYAVLAQVRKYGAEEVKRRLILTMPLQEDKEEA